MTEEEMKNSQKNNQVKSIYLFGNGCVRSTVLKFQLDTSLHRSWKMLLDDITKTALKPGNMLREIRSARHYTKVISFDDFWSGEMYILISQESSPKEDKNNPLNPIQYRKISKSNLSLKKETFAENGEQKDECVSLKKSLKSLGIKVYKNGDPYTPAIYVRLKIFHETDMIDLYRILAENIILLNNKPIKKLFNLNGKPIRDISEIENGTIYVAAGNEGFSNIRYGQTLRILKGGIVPSRIYNIKFLNQRPSAKFKSVDTLFKSQKIQNDIENENTARTIPMKNELLSLSSNHSNENSKTFYTNLFHYVNKNIIGRDVAFKGPFGNRLIIYCDYTASGRPLQFIEEFIAKVVLPKYSNTHTTNTEVAKQTSKFRQEAREIIGKSCNVSSEDVVLFVGSGSTGAINKLAYHMNHGNAPIVIMGPFEHHSNMLPWRKIAHSTHRIKINTDGGMDIKDLESVLKVQKEIAASEHRQLIGVFSAASNVTGIVTDTNMISEIMHIHNGLVFWDYASGGPYLNIDMNPVEKGKLVYKDAAYFSMHKFVGGVQSPGVLIAKRKLFNARQMDPQGPGGGTVFFVGRENHLFLEEIEEREEGGTPDIVGAIRAGLAFQLKSFLTTDAISQREDYIVKYTKSKLENVPNLIVLGGFQTDRIAIFSFLFRHVINENEYLFLHHHFACCLLNDLFGIQSRSGCACAGPYGMDLLGIDEDLAEKYLSLLVGIEMKEISKLKCLPHYPSRGIFKPGFLRINIPYFMPDVEVDFVLDAIAFVAENGYKFLPQYNFNPETILWTHINQDNVDPVKTLNDISYSRNCMDWRNVKPATITKYPLSFSETMSIARDKMNEIIQNPFQIKDESKLFEESTLDLRWFMLPCEACSILWHMGEVSRSSKALFYPGSMAIAFPPFEKTKLENCNTQEIKDNNSNELKLDFNSITDSSGKSLIGHLNFNENGNSVFKTTENGNSMSGNE